MMELELAQSTNVGRIRDHNEDAFGSWTPETRALKRSHGWLLALADGVGGHDFGEVASALTIETLTAGFPAAAETTPTTLLADLIRTANERIVARAEEQKGSGQSMATTVVACTLRYDQAHIAHVGDSRCYRIRPAKPFPDALQLTRDHTLQNDQALLAQVGDLGKHTLTRSLGLEIFVAPDLISTPVEPGDVLMLCSDGLHGALSERRIATICAQSKLLSEIATQLTDEATAADGSDNATVILARVNKIERVGLYRGRPYRLPM
jgi:serine/threonine protein phosphatase PrpC